MNTPVAAPRTLRVLLVDDETLARARLRTLLGDCRSPGAVVVGEAGNAVQAMEAMRAQGADVALLDIHMPGADGITLGRAISELPVVPALIFVTAHAEHAVQAFELEAVDYLTKPVRLERLQVALQKAERYLLARGDNAALNAADDVVVIQDRGRTERVPVREVLYFKAELKYVTVRTAVRSYILDASLNELEERFAQQFMRVHRNALVARAAMRALENHIDPDEGAGWAVRLNGLDEVIAVSRRQLAAVRELLSR